MFEKISVIIFIFSALVGMIMALFNVVGANVYDLREIKKKKQRLLHPYARQFRNRPLISVLIYTYNDERVIRHCLESILKSSYRKFEIIVMDNNSQDKTKIIMRNFINMNSTRSIKMVAKRTRGTRLDSFQTAFRNHARGDLIMLLDAQSLLDKRALSNAVLHFNSDNRIKVLMAHARVVSSYSTIGVFQKYENLLRFRSQKFSSTSNSTYATPLEGIMYHRDTFGRILKSCIGAPSKDATVCLPLLRLGNKENRIYYASDFVTYSEAHGSLYGLLTQRYCLQQSQVQALIKQRRLLFSRDSNYSKFLTCLRLPFLICSGIALLFTPVLLTYFIYLAVSLHQPILLIVSWGLLCLFLIIAIWGDEQLKISQKSALSLFTPSTYGVFYLMSFIQMFAVLTGIFKLSGFRFQIFRYGH